MSSQFIDADSILSANEQWMKLDKEWKTVDLETEEDQAPAPIVHVSSIDLRQTTFDSSSLFKKVRRKVNRRLSKVSSFLDYNDFFKDLQEREKSRPQFFFINGQITSAMSIEEICNNIDDIFKSIEKLSSASSTLRKDKPKSPKIVECSISTNGLSFDETPDSGREKHDSDNIDRFIDEAFEKLNYSMMTCDDDAKESVTTLVKRFSNILNRPAINCSPRRRRECSSRFKELAAFWENCALNNVR